MRTKNVPGEFAFKALIKKQNGWCLTNELYFNQKEVVYWNEGYEVIWPVEELDNKAIYVPAQEELE